MKKLLWIPLDSHRHKENDKLFGSILRALQTVFDARIYGEEKDFTPDYILYQGGLSPEKLQELKNKYLCKVFMYTGDVRYYPQKSLTDYEKMVDVYFLPSTNLNNHLLGRVEFLWEYIQDWRFIPPREMNEGKIIFVGNNYETVPGRAEAINFIRKHCPDVEVCGTGWGAGINPVDNELVPELYNQCYAVICENNWNDISDYFTPRNIGAMAAGGCPLIHKFSSLKNEGVIISVSGLVYQNKYELLDAIDYLKRNSSLRNDYAKRAYEMVSHYFTPNKWAEKVLTLIKKYE